MAVAHAMIIEAGIGFIYIIFLTKICAWFTKHIIRQAVEFMERQNAIIIYERKDGAHFEVTLKEETIWLSQQQIANLFVVKKSAVSKHIKNIQS